MVKGWRTRCGSTEEKNQTENISVTAQRLLLGGREGNTAVERRAGKTNRRCGADWRSAGRGTTHRICVTHKQTGAHPGTKTHPHTHRGARKQQKKIKRDAGFVGGGGGRRGCGLRVRPERA